MPSAKSPDRAPAQVGSHRRSRWPALTDEDDAALADLRARRKRREAAAAATAAEEAFDDEVRKPRPAARRTRRVAPLVAEEAPKPRRPRRTKDADEPAADPEGARRPARAAPPEGLPRPAAGDGDDGGSKKPKVKLPWWAYAAGGFVALLVLLAIWGQINAENWYLGCDGKYATAHRGSGFPFPFGKSKLSGDRYKPVRYTSKTICGRAEFSSRASLEAALLRIVVREAELQSVQDDPRRLANARRLVSQGYMLAGDDRKTRAKLRVILADIEYREAREKLRALVPKVAQVRDLLTQAKEGKAAHAKELDAWLHFVSRLLEMLRNPLAKDKEPIPLAGIRRPTPSPSATNKLPSPPVRATPSKSATPLAPTPGGDTPPRRALPPAKRAPPAPKDPSDTGGGILL